MLILERVQDQAVEITAPNGDVIRVTHCGQHGERIRFGFEAPRSYEILRDDARTRTPKEGATR